MAKRKTSPVQRGDINKLFSRIKRYERGIHGIIVVVDHPRPTKWVELDLVKTQAFVESMMEEDEKQHDSRVKVVIEGRED